jgi:hypothetical protein
VRVVDVLVEPAYSTAAPQRRSDNVIRSFRSFPSRPKVTRAEIGDITWPRTELLEVARLLDRLEPPSFHDPERFHLGALWRD